MKLAFRLAWLNNEINSILVDRLLVFPNTSNCFLTIIVSMDYWFCLHFGTVEKIRVVMPVVQALNSFVFLIRIIIHIRHHDFKICDNFMKNTLLEVPIKYRTSQVLIFFEISSQRNLDQSKTYFSLEKLIQSV